MPNSQPNVALEPFRHSLARYPRAIGIIAAAALGAAAIELSNFSSTRLDYTQFIGIPFIVGCAAILVANRFRETDWRLLETLWTASLSILLCGTLVFATGNDGLLCLILSGPLALATALCGSFFSAKLAQTFPKRNTQATALAGLVFLLPLLMGFESNTGHSPNLRRVVSTIQIDAEPSAVWSHLLQYPEIKGELDLLFRAGIAYPLRSSIEHPGKGAQRLTFFSTGIAEQRIIAYEDQSLLVFDIVESPHPLIELSPFNRGNDRHLRDTVRPRAGKLRIHDLGNGQSQLEYSYYYYQSLWPHSYWSQISDVALSKIQRRILSHVKELSEKSANSPLPRHNGQITGRLDRIADSGST